MHKTLITVSALATVALATPALAQTDVQLGAGARVRAAASTTIQERIEARTETRAQLTGQREEQAKQRAYTEIDRRIRILTELNARVQGLTHVSDTGKMSVDATVQTQLTSLNDLRSRIEADDSTTTLKADMQSITKSYRIFALVIPQGHIKVAADRIHAGIDAMTALANKIATRLTDAAGAGKDVASLQDDLTAVTTELADAAASADAAVALVANLQPDNGDAALMASNKAALKEARTKISDALKSLQTARADLNKIVAGIKQLNAGASASAEATTTEQ